MKIQKFVFILPLALIFFMVLGVPRSYAGDKTSQPVSVTIISGNYYVAGSVADTRNSTNPNAYLLCGYLSWTASDGTVTNSGYCQAYDGTNSAYCQTSNPLLLQTIQSLHGDSFVEFATNSYGGPCQYVLIQNGSMYTPKTP